MYGDAKKVDIPAKHSVDNDTKGHQEAGCHDRHASESVDDGSATSQEHGRDEDVGKESKAQVDKMRRMA